MITILVIIAILPIVSVTFFFFLVIKKKNMDIWLPNYFSRKIEKPCATEPVHIIFAFCDHYEPRWGKAKYDQEVRRVDTWCSKYPILASKHFDADGCHPKHTFFYPQEEYREEHLRKLKDLCAGGFGEIEIHLHHDNDTREGLTEKLQSFLETLDKVHDVVSIDPDTNEYRYAFIHGNWALDNSRPDGKWCGVTNELSVLAKTGCYADFTLPSAPSNTQTAKINSIYYATGRDGACKSHNNGVEVIAGKTGTGDLMIIQGPLCLNWRNRKFGILPRIENSDIRKSFPPTPDRVDLWVKCSIQVKNQPQWRFIKVHTHGTQDDDMETLLDQPVDEMFAYLENTYNDQSNYKLHYVSAREMYNIIKAAEAGLKGDPNKYRDFVIPRPRFLQKDEAQLEAGTYKDRTYNEKSEPAREK